MANEKIRRALATNEVRHWELADMLGIHSVTLSRKLRHELPAAEQAHILDMITTKAKERLEG